MPRRNRRPLRHFPSGTSPQALLLRHFAALTAGGSEVLAGEAALLSLVAGLGGAPAERPAVPAAIALARQRIDDDPAAPLGLEDLARLTGLSRFQVLRAFQRATGLPPHAYQTQRRAHLARRLILAGCPLAEAAAASGFADQSHMTRLFTRHYGLPPGAFRP